MFLKSLKQPAACVASLLVQFCPPAKKTARAGGTRRGEDAEPIGAPTTQPCPARASCLCPRARARGAWASPSHLRAEALPICLPASTNPRVSLEGAVILRLVLPALFQASGKGKKRQAHRRC